MPDWKALVRTRLAGLKLEGSNESEVFDELAQHLEDRYEELLQSGIPAAEAERIALEPLHTSPSLVEALSRARHRPVPEPPARPHRLANLLDLREVVIHLETQPHVGAATESFRQANGHFGRDAGLLADEVVQCLPRHAQNFGCLGNAQAERVKTFEPNDASGVRRILHNHNAASLNDNQPNRHPQRFRSRSET
jgi:hypothetical protein